MQQRAGSYVAGLLLTIAPLIAQWRNYPTPGITQTADGKPNLSAPPPPPSQVAAVNVKSFGAVGDGVTDDLAAINAVLALDCSSGAVYFPAGVYLVSAPLNTIGCSLTVFGDGSSSSLLRLAGPGSNIYSPLLDFSGAGNVVVHDLGLDGQNVHAVGLQLVSVTSANIYNIIIRNFGTPGYSAGNHIAEDGLYAANVQNLTVANCVITGNERSGIEMIPVANATISGNIISGNGYYAGVAEWLDPGGTSGPLNIQFLNNIARNNGSGGFDVETGSNFPAAYGKISGNDIEDCGNDMWTYGVGAVIGHNAYGEISNNIVHNFNQVGPQFSGYGSAVVATPSGSITITNNYVSNTGAFGIVVEGTSGLGTVTGNWTSFAPSGGFYIFTLTGATVTGNYSFGNSGPPYQIFSVTGTTNPNYSSPPIAAAAPTVPGGLTASVASRDQLNLAWTASTDTFGVKGYYVYRNGVQIAQTAGTQYPDTGLAAGTLYVYTVAAFDASGNVSTQSPGVAGCTTSCLDDNAPAPPTGLSVTVN